jgi:Domain of unknown function (DUF4410)
MNNRKCIFVTGRLLAGIALLIMGGCASARVDQTMRTISPLPKPDMVVVYNFAVTASEVKLDQGIMQKAMRDSDSRSVSAEENKVGHMVADKLAGSLVEELRKVGIPAVRASSLTRPSGTTALITGQFVTVDQGNQTARFWVGFGMGGTELRTRIQVIQGGQLVAEGETSTRSNLKPGMLVSLGAAGAAESVAPIVVGAAGSVVTEGFTGTIEADAKRTAEQVAERVKQAYQNRGWLP